VSEEQPQHEWKYQESFPIYGRMKQLINLTIKATEQQLVADRRKLRKLQYGS
jgi:hypothetical protein